MACGISSSRKNIISPRIFQLWCRMARLRPLGRICNCPNNVHRILMGHRILPWTYPTRLPDMQNNTLICSNLPLLYTPISPMCNNSTQGNKLRCQNHTGKINLRKQDRRENSHHNLPGILRLRQPTARYRIWLVVLGYVPHNAPQARLQGYLSSCSSWLHSSHKIVIMSL